MTDDELKDLIEDLGFNLCEHVTKSLIEFFRQNSEEIDPRKVFTFFGPTISAISMEMLKTLYKVFRELEMENKDD